MNDPPSQRVLIVDDEEASREGLSRLVGHWGYVTETAGDGNEGLAKVGSFRPHVVIADLVMPNMDGLALLQAVSEKTNSPAVVMLTAKGSIATAVEAMKSGAFDYLTKPVDTDQLQTILRNAMDRGVAYEAIESHDLQLESSGRFGRLVGDSEPMRALYELMRQAGPTAASVLIVGESGTGKELVARTLHELSPRREGAFVALNCAAIPETLLESEIFGHEKGAFTGADGKRQGCFELAHGGTLFLDEVAEMAPATQAKLLRVLEERSFRRLGGSQEIRVDVRVLAATNRDPLEAIKDDRLREDLFYRLNVFTLELAPLRKRRSDVPALVSYFIQEFNEANGKSVSRCGTEALDLLEAYGWPGNVRELRNVIERAVIVAKGREILADELPAPVIDSRGGGEKEDGVDIPVGTTVEQAERDLILKTLEATGQNKTRAAEILGISLKTLHNKLKKYREQG